MDMETTRNEMPDNAKIFFIKLKNYLDTKLYYYGSIQRYDYFPEFSDIDVAIFCENIESTILKLQNFLNLPRNKFQKFVHRIPRTGKIVYGWKVKYVDNNKKFTMELAIYDETIKEEVLTEKRSKNNIPDYVCILLYILKVLYYKWRILPFNIFVYLKKICLNYLVEGKDSEYIIL